MSIRTVSPVVIIPTGEEEKQRGEQETDEGTYFALSYRKKRVCIDTGLMNVLRQNLGSLTNPDGLAGIDRQLYEFTADYHAMWWKNPRTGQFLELKKITVSTVGTDTLVLTPHYKVPNDQSMGRAPLHV